MYHKLSNTASGLNLEAEFNTPLKYPHLYRKEILINGEEEATIPIITMGDSGYMVPAIWGILPENFKDDWSDFQSVYNSLYLSLEELEHLSWCSDALKKRRCLIPITGFFISYLINGEIYPYYFHKNSDTPFCLTGIYNTMQDGFITCSIITTTTDHELKKPKNLGRTIPIILPKELHKEWLRGDLTEDKIKGILKSTSDFKLTAHPISKEFFKNNISYSSMLSRANYEMAPDIIILANGEELLVQ